MTNKENVEITTTSGRVVRFGDIVSINPRHETLIAYVKDASGFTAMSPVFISRDAIRDAGLTIGC
jgi:hypothetical protein